MFQALTDHFLDAFDDEPSDSLKGSQAVPAESTSIKETRVNFLKGQGPYGCSKQTATLQKHFTVKGFHDRVMSTDL